jgi:hypothetical protein
VTSQTKKFIELSDIVALRFSCNHCGASLSLSLLKDVREDRLRQCPNCYQPWAQMPSGSSIELTIAKFVDDLKKLNDVLVSGYFSGFLMALELKEEPMPSASQK